MDRTSAQENESPRDLREQVNRGQRVPLDPELFVPS